MRRTLGFAVLISLLLVGNSWARVWYVKPDSTGAVINIQAGIDSCGAGDTVVAMPGVYSGDGNWDLDFKGKPIVVMSASRHDPAITNSTVIDGGLKHRGFYFHSGETNAAILEGFIITNGRDCDCTECSCLTYWGGGIACDSASSPVIRYNKISNCLAHEGGGIYCLGPSAPIISKNEICQCMGGQGGGIYCSGFSAPIISHNRIYQCEATQGTAIFCSDSSTCIIDNNEIYDNCAIYSNILTCMSCSPVFINNIIHDNIFCRGVSGSENSPSWPAEPNPFLVWCLACPSVTIVGNYIYGNEVGGISINGTSVTIRGNDMWGNHSIYTGMTIECDTVDIVGNSICYNPGEAPAIRCQASRFAKIDSNYVHGNGTDGDWLYCEAAIAVINSKAIITNNEVSSNIHGGIRYEGDSAGSIENNIIVDNGRSHFRPRAGGIYCSAPVNITGNIIKNNGNYLSGAAGISCYSSASIKDNIIALNSSIGGGGIWCEGLTASIVNNTIVGNSGRHGAGISIGAGCHPTLVGNIISDNFLMPCDGICTFNDGGGIFSESDSVTISCCDVYNNQVGNYMGLPDQTGLNGNFSANPIFCDTSFGIYTLHVASPCLPGNHPNGSSCGLIGALAQGCNYAATLLQEHHEGVDASGIAITWKLAEVGGHMSFLVLRAEMPNTEYREMPAVSISSDGVSFSFKDVGCKPGATYRYRIDISNSIDASHTVLFVTDPLEMPAATLALHQNFPNPFNPSTSIRYELPVKTAVVVEIYDVSGGRVARLVDGEEDRGPHVAEWRGLDDRGRSVGSGVYFYRLRAGKETISKKMVLMR